jgi:predicted methyltransferase/ribosomal protein S18 acetylase RimI-like enzyme
MHPEHCEKAAERLETISRKAEVEEGAKAVRRVLREVFRQRKVGTKELARSVKLPVPVVAAIRRELESDGLLARNRGASLTQEGEVFAREQLGLAFRQKLRCPTCQGRSINPSDDFLSLLPKLTSYLSTRPKPLPWIDQAHGTPQTALLRALFMLEEDDVEGRRILFLGDDDCTSIAVAMLQAAVELTVVDVDSRLLNTIRTIADEANLSIACVEHDVRKPLPSKLLRKYDVVFTDPPYTLPGVALFVSRGITALQPRKGASIYLAFAHQPPSKMLILQKALNAMGLAVAEQIPRFNRYEGAEMFANTTFLMHLETTAKTQPLLVDAFDGKLYTGEITPTVRTYTCSCGSQVEVGTTASIRTIEELKSHGCPKCGSAKGFKLVKKQKLRDILAGKLEVRSFEWADFPIILEFEREIARNSFPETPVLDSAYHRRKLENAVKRELGGLKVAVLGSEIVGWLWLKTEEDRTTRERFGYIKSVIVKPKYRHQGLGRSLMKAAKRYFASKGIDRIDLIVSASNYQAAFFFEEMGLQSKHATMRQRLQNGKGNSH